MRVLTNNAVPVLDTFQSLTEVRGTCNVSEWCEIANAFEGQMEMPDRDQNAELSVYDPCREVP